MLGSLIAARYRLDSELGRGGMGIVYRAHDTLLKRDVAIKLLSSTGLATAGRARLMGEARAVASLNHPNIVAIYDAGETGGEKGSPRPFIVMELLDGPTLHEQRPQSLDETLKITRQICAALQHAHDHDIIHRDLKPENVMFAADMVVKLMDFGLARSLTTRMTSEGTLMGTLSYMAPEMILGLEIDHKADLYALGIMLYELSTGRLPFESNDPVAVLSQHLHAPVVPPLAHNPEMPPLLDDLIVSLLEKEPERRPASAAALLAALDQLDQPQALAERSEPLSILDRIVRGRLVGREQELAETRAIWSQAAAGQGQVLLVSGEPGIGKTRLVEELITQARVSGGRSLAGASYAEGGSPYAPFRQILGEILAGDDLKLPDELLPDLLTLAPEARSRFPQQPQINPGDPQQEQQRLLDNVARTFNLLSGRSPLLLLLEDAHWADSATISLLLHLARSVRRQPLMIVVTYREVEIDQARALHRALLDLQRERLATRIKLARLDREGTQALLETLFDEEITPEFLDSIYHETEGNPFFIEEISKALVESGQLTFEDGRWHRPQTEELGIPQSIRVAVQTRAGVLPEASRKILEQAAVLGRVFDLPTLKLATELDEDPLIEALEEALAAQLIEEEPGQEERFSFVHALIPASLVAGLRTLRRRRLHRRAATAHEVIHPDEYELLAHHYIEAGQIEKGVHYLLLAGDRARAQYAHEEAIDSYRGAIEYLKDEGQLEQAARALMKLGLAYNNAFDFAQSRHAYQEGFSLWQQISLSPSTESAQPAPHALRVRFGEPTLLDPAFAIDTNSDIFIEQFYCGLVQLTVEMDVVPDIALSWEVLEEGRRYRFHLRNDVFWSDGVPVTAADFVFAWERVLMPQNSTQNALSLFMIKNGRDFHDGRLADFDAVGIKAIDALTLEIELENPEGTFLYALCDAVSFAVPRHRLLEIGAPWMAWDELITNGPFMPDEWVPGQRMRLLSNPRYHGYRSGNLKAVEIIVLAGNWDEGNLALYESDAVDTAVLGPVDAARGRNSFASDHLSFPTLSTLYLGFNTQTAPFSDKRVRQAFALAFDREYLSDILFQGFITPATGGFVPPRLHGHVPGIGLPYNREEARRLLAEAGYGAKDDFPPVNLMFGTSRRPFKIAKYLAERWQTLLGIEVEIDQLPWSAMLERFMTNPPAIYIMAWTADMPDPDNFLRLCSFRQSSGWRNEAYEHLIQQAREMMDQAGRMALYHQAEEILVEETPIIPLHYGRLELLIKPWVRRFPTSPLKFWYWKDVVIEPH